MFRLTGLLGLLFAAIFWLGSVEPSQAQNGCAPSQSGCVTYTCPNGITLRAQGGPTAAQIANACNRQLGGPGAPASVPDGCVRLEVGAVPHGTRSLIIAVHNPGTFRDACGVEFCHDCAPYHSERGHPDLTAELPISSDGFVSVPTSWLIGRHAFAWLCIRDTNISVALHREHLRYLVQHRRTPVGDPLEWAPSRYLGGSPSN